MSFNDNFRIVGGLVASIEKGSRYRFDQALVNGELWLPAGGDGTMLASVLMFKSYRQHFPTTTTNVSVWRARSERTQSPCRKRIREREAERIAHIVSKRRGTASAHQGREPRGWQN